MTLQWAHPAWLWAIIPLAIFLLWTWRGAPAAFRLPEAAAEGGAGRAALLAGVPGVLRAVALLILVLALARPRMALAGQEERGEGVPIVVAIDVSSSMLAQDFRPRDRLEVAKGVVRRFVAGREDDPIGVVAFAAEALTIVPITTHRAILDGALQSLRVGLLEDGTAIGDGLATAVNRLRRVEAPDRVVILMSDGESNRGEVEPLAAARAAATFGIRVFTIGVGSEGVARVPVGRAPAGFEYAERPVEIDETTLRSIAELTGGEYFRATDPAALERIYGRIDQLVRAPLETRRLVEYREWYPWLLLAAAALLLMETLWRGSRWGVVP